MERLTRFPVFHNAVSLFHVSQSGIEVVMLPSVDSFPVDNEVVKMIVFCFSIENLR